MELQTMPLILKKPRGRPPLGARLNADGKYELPDEAIEAAAERVVKHRDACRARYTATRAALHIAKPGIFKTRRPTTNSKLDGDKGEAGNPV